MFGVLIKFIYSPAVLEKLLTKHLVSSKEVEQCFINRDGGLLEDKRENHATTPLTRWFIAETNQCRLLKICFIPIGTKLHIKTAYEPNAEEIRIYKQHAY